MAKILIGVPNSRHYQPFMDSLPLFVNEVSKEHLISLCFIKGRKVDEARNDIADFFLKTDFEYLLFLDDDHEGHSKEMLDALLKCDTYVSSILSHSKYFPYSGNLLFYSGYKELEIKYADHNYTNGVRECDLVGFGMTLIKRETFSKIDKPYFVATNNSCEDNYFCDRLIEKGIRPVGVWDYSLPHNGITRESAKENYNKSMMEFCVMNNGKATIEKKFNHVTNKEELIMHF